MTAGGLSSDQKQWIAIDQDEMEAASAQIARRFKAKYLRGLRKLLGQQKLEMPPSLAREESLGRMLKSIELTMGEREFIDAFSQHILPMRLRRFRMAGIFAPLGRDARLAVARELLGERTDEPSAEAGDETNPHDRSDEEQEDEGSYVACPECDKRMKLRIALEAHLVCPLLQVAAAALRRLQSGASESVRQAIVTVARAGAPGCTVCRVLLRGAFGENPALMLTAETLVQDRLREQRQQQERSGKQQQRGPPGAATS